jgi:hypothetical protein
LGLGLIACLVPSCRVLWHLLVLIERRCSRGHPTALTTAIVFEAMMAVMGMLPMSMGAR